jgi:hypothetical protein
LQVTINTEASIIKWGLLEGVALGNMNLAKARPDAAKIVIHDVVSVTREEAVACS